MSIQPSQEEVLFNALSFNDRAKFGISTPSDLRNDRKRQLVLEKLNNFFSRRLSENTERYNKAKAERDKAQEEFTAYTKEYYKAWNLYKEEPTEENKKAFFNSEIQWGIKHDRAESTNSYLSKLNNWV